LDPSQKNSFLIPIAENAHNSAVEASSITTALQNAR
jgi:hypothetical protein